MNLAEKEPGFAEVRAGNLGVRLAVDADELDAAQALRWQVFYAEMGAVPDEETRRSGRDRDAFDAVADHLLVLDHDRGEGAKAIVGTYRLIRRPGAAKLGRFYSQGEYDVSKLLAFPGGIMELGRSCVDASYRNRGTLQLLWRGIAAYVFHHDIQLMFGCASLPGTNLDVLADQLTYLATHHMAPEAIRPRALPDRYVEMHRKDPALVDMKAAMVALPPLVKGYLRLGGFVGDGAVTDEQFNCTDVAVVVKTDLVTEKYYKHYERGAPARD